MLKKNQNSLFYKYEFVLFTAFLLINIIPIAIFKFLPTLDGPSHLHNANLIKNLVLSDYDFLNNFYELNTDLVPNWSGHFILALLGSLLPAWITDKLIITVYLVLLPISFRWFVKSNDPENYMLYLLIFPFCYSFTFFLGFYNFSFALILLFVILAYWNKTQIKPTWVNILTLFLLFTTLYFSHVFVFFIAIMAVGIIVLKQLAFEINNIEIKQPLRLFLLRVSIIGLTSGAGIFLSAKFLLSRTATNYTFIPKIELIKWIRDIRPTIVFNFGHEGVYTHFIFYLFFILTAYAIVYKIREIRKTKTNFRELLISLAIKNDLWFIFSFLLLLLYFFMPDSNGYSGYFTVRMGLLLFLFYIAWLSFQQFKKWVIYFSVIVVFIANSGLNFYYIKQVRQLNNLAIEINNQSKFIEDHTVVLPVNFSDNWMHGHFSNYLGIDKPIVILENYECGTGYFPVIWKNEFPNLRLDGIDSHDLNVAWKSNSETEKHFLIDYVFILGNNAKTDSVYHHTIKSIEEKYDLVSKTKNTLLFKIRSY